MTVKILKHLLTYCLFLLLMFAFNYRTINYCLSVTATSIAYLNDMDCEEKNTDETADEKEKKTEKEYLAINKSDAFIIYTQMAFAQKSKLKYITSDYSIGVYSPPEL